MNRLYLRTTLVAASLFCGLFVGTACLAPAPRLLWNPSTSAPVGLYRVKPGTMPQAGDFVVIDPPPAFAAWLAERQYLPHGVPLLKHVAALPGARVCRSGTFVTIDGRGAARAMAHDRTGRELPVWTGCRTVRENELFLLNAAPDSLDGRYFGPLSAAGLIGTAHPILTRQTPSAPFRWHRRGAFGAPMTIRKETQS